MLGLRNAIAASVVSACAFLSAADSQAATVTLDFNDPVPAPLVLDPDSPGIVGGNCADDSAPCLGVNKNGPAVLSIIAPLTFSVTSFWFQLLGNKDDLIVETNLGTTTLLESFYDHNNGGQALDVSGLSMFQNITYLSFLTNTGNARVDDLVVNIPDGGPTPNPVPLPASALLLLGGMGGLAALRRRKKLA